MLLARQHPRKLQHGLFYLKCRSPLSPSLLGSQLPCQDSKLKRENEETKCKKKYPQISDSELLETPDMGLHHRFQPSSTWCLSQQNYALLRQRLPMHFSGRGYPLTPPLNTVSLWRCSWDYNPPSMLYASSFNGENSNGFLTFMWRWCLTVKSLL